MTKTTSTKKEMKAYRQANTSTLACHACGATRTTLRKIAPGRYACATCR